MTAQVPAIETKALRVVYNPGLFAGRKVGLETLDLQVPVGSIYGFLGQNGAGKTTTIKALMGLLHPTSGQAWIMGVDTAGSAARRRVGFMPENPYFYEYLTAREALHFYGRLSGTPRKDRRRRTDELLDRFGLSHAKNTPLREFSKGMRQRLGLAQALLHEPPVVILDEPMSGLDPLGRHEIRENILALREQGRTVFFSSHILGDVEDVCDRVCVIHHGRKVVEGPLASLLSPRAVEVSVAASGLPPEGVPAAAAKARRAWHDGELYHVVVDDEDAALEVTEILRAAGGVIRRLIPHREPLEDYFVRVTGDDSTRRPETKAEEGARGGKEASA